MEYAIKTLSDSIRVTGIANVHFFNFEKYFSTRSDSHPFYELVFVSNGALQITSEHYTGVLEKECMIIHSKNEKHALTADRQAETVVIIIGFTYEGDSLERFSSMPVKLNDSDIKKLAEIVKEARNVFAPPHNIPVANMRKNRNQPYGAEQLLKNLLEYFLISLKREYSFAAEEPGIMSHVFPIREILAYLDNKYTEKITLSELAFLFGTNRTTLCREFKNAVGTTVAEYMAEKRLEAAKERIVSGNDTFTEISAALRFDSIHYFTRFFKKRVGMTPKEYRKAMRQTAEN